MSKTVQRSELNQNELKMDTFLIILITHFSMFKLHTFFKINL